MEAREPQADVAAAWKKTQAAYIWTSILNTPFWAIFNMLPFILYKDLHATVIQITAIIILKPATSLFSLYWSGLIERRKDRLLPNLIWARVFSHLPFFLFPFIDNPWYFIASFGLYMMLERGAIPAWMEVLKLNVPEDFRKKTVAYSHSLTFIGAALFPFILGGTMDSYSQSWRWIFPIAALVSLVAIIPKMMIPIASEPAEKASADPVPLASVSEVLWKPWRNVWELVHRRKDFMKYQMGFMLGGAGLIIMQPALPVFFVDALHLSYMELAVALTLCKGVGYAVASPAWVRLMNSINIYRFNGWVTLLAVIFPLCLIASQTNLSWLYVGYLLYGVMQAGSALSWNLSGPMFSQEEDSTVYTSVNVLTVGLRGCFVPAIGSLLTYYIHPTGVMLMGGLLCAMSTGYMWMQARERRLNPT